jgi:hypothetical protein
MRYRLRTLLIVLALGPPSLAGWWISLDRYSQWKRREEISENVRAAFSAGSGIRSRVPLINAGFSGDAAN